MGQFTEIAMATEEEITRLNLDADRARYQRRFEAEQKIRDDEETIKLNLNDERVKYQARIEAEKNYKEQDKMGVVFFAIMLALCVIGDGIDVFTGGTFGWLIGLFIDAVLLISTGLTKAGRKQFKRILVGALGDSIPILAFLPFRSIFLVWAFIKSRSTKLQSIA